MYIRQPKLSPPDNIPDYPPPEYQKLYQVKTITPIYGGGVEGGESDIAMPVRAAAIRGQLRYWWRFLARHRPKDPITDFKLLFGEERALWGGMGESDKDYASKLNIRVTKVSSVQIKPCYQYEPKGMNNNGKPKYEESFLHGIPAYALFLGKGKKPCDRHNPLKPGDTPADVIVSGLKFELEITSFDNTLIEKEWNSVLQAIQWWANFGGIGARTRRGLGSVSIDEIKSLTNEDVKVFGCELRNLTEQKDAAIAWKNSIAKLQSFRQGKNIGRRPGQDERSPNKLGRSYWPEPDSIRLITGKNAIGKHMPHNTSGTFPRAAFGLPIIFDFNVKPSVGEPPKTELSPASDKHERMASPLILKAQYLGKNKFLPVALLLPTKHLLNLETTLKCVEGSHQGLPRTLSRSNGDIWWPLNENQKKNLAEDIKPLKNRGYDALSAFMHYFSEGKSEGNNNV